ncbi:MAG TPA: hypothetical protein VF911_04720 [Thermoanaerobaculia bacterium]
MVIFESSDLVACDLAAAALQAAGIAYSRATFAGGVETVPTLQPAPGPGTIFLIRVPREEAARAKKVVHRFTADVRAPEERARDARRRRAGRIVFWITFSLIIAKRVYDLWSG